MPQSGSGHKATGEKPSGRGRSFLVRGDLLRASRVARGWTQQDAADRAGVSDRLIRKAEAGGPIELPSLALLAQLYSTAQEPLPLKALLADPLGTTAARPDAAQIEVLVRRWYDELWNKGRLEVIEELAAPDCLLHAQGDELRGHDSVRRRMEALYAAFSEFDFAIEQLAVQEDLAIVRWKVHLTHTGFWMGEPPSGRRLLIRGSSWIRIACGLLAEGWDYWDQQQVLDDRPRL